VRDDDAQRAARPVAEPGRAIPDGMQNERDDQAFVQAIADGRLEAEAG
jgi:hypothetical protein